MNSLQSKQSPIHFQQVKLIIIEDEKSIRNVYERMFREFINKIIYGDSVEAEMSIYKLKEPAIILCDEIMPKLQGSDLANRTYASRIGRNQELLIVSGGIEVPEEEYALMIQAGVIKTIINKPFDVASLRKIVKDAAIAICSQL